MTEERKPVTILFADVVGSTAMAASSDPEVVRGVMGRHFERMRAIAERHGGTVEKFAGDSIMVVFGVPRVHDDDAERAVRAALAMAGAAGPLTVRVGVNSGEAVTSTRPDGQFLVSGDAVNVAARLQQAADPGEVIVGALTEALTRRVIEYSSRQPIEAKGKAELLTAFRAERAFSVTPVQARGVAGLRAKLVGRQHELRLILQTFDRVAEDGRPHLFTLVGAAGVGKSRLVAEALEALAAKSPRVMRGRCLPYGQGITYWPFAEMFGEEAGIALTEGRTSAIAKLERWVGEMAVPSERAAIAARLAVVLGYQDAAVAIPDVPPERIDREMAWGIRRLLEAVAARAPLIVVIDDLQWSEPVVMTVIDQVMERARQSPLLMIAVARPELLESHEAWAVGKANATTITLDPLSGEDTALLVSRLLDVDELPAVLRARVVERSEGTPLFCEEFLQMLIDQGRLVRSGHRWRAVPGAVDTPVPPSIQSLLAARLDTLPDGEKRLLQAASVIGERFGLDQIQNLAPELEVESEIDSLLHKGLVVESAAGADASDVRFKHMLIRDAAYALLAKSDRARLHERFLEVLSEQGDQVQLVEILAHHSERAFSLTRELQLEGEVLERRARSAFELNARAAERALKRSDTRTVAAQLAVARAAADALPGGGGPGAVAKLTFIEATLKRIAGDYTDAAALFERAARLAEQAGDLQLTAAARIGDAWVYAYGPQDREGILAGLTSKVELAVEACRAAHDHKAELEARFLGGISLWGGGRVAEFGDLIGEILDEALDVDAMALAAELHFWLNLCNRNLGRGAEADRHLAEAERLSAELGLREVAAGCVGSKGRAGLMRGDLSAWEEAGRQQLAAAEEIGASTPLIGAHRFLGDALLRQGRGREAIRSLERGIEISEERGDRWHRTELYSLRARAALVEGRLDDADRFVERALDVLRKEDVTANCEINETVGVVRAAEGRDEDAEEAFKLALHTIRGTGYLPLEMDADVSYARFLTGHGRFAEAEALLAECDRFMEYSGYSLWRPAVDGIRATIRAGSTS